MRNIFRQPSRARRGYSRVSSRASLTARCQVPSVRRWMAAANAISGSPFTAAVRVRHRGRGGAERRRRESTELLILSQDGMRTRYVGNGRYAANMLWGNGLSMKMLDEDLQEKLTGERGQFKLNFTIQRSGVSTINHFDIFTCGEASRSMDDIWLLLSSVKICQTEHSGGQRSTGTWVIEVTEFKFQFRSDL